MDLPADRRLNPQCDVHGPGARPSPHALACSCPKITLTAYTPLPNDSLNELVVRSIKRFADEDHCTPDMWVARAARSTVMARLAGEKFWRDAETEHVDSA